MSSHDTQAFVGAMQKAQKGVFITTSDFTKEAKKYQCGIYHDEWNYTAASDIKRTGKAGDSGEDFDNGLFDIQ